MRAPDHLISTAADSVLGGLLVESIERRAAMLTGEGRQPCALRAFCQVLEARWQQLGGTVAAARDQVRQDPMNRKTG